MPNYDLGRIGDEQFEHLIQALLKKVIGPGTTTFGAGPDGGREATFSGPAPYPSPQAGWSGNWIFQAKFHDVQRIGADKARDAVLNDLKSELSKICFKYKRKFENYILATNVPLSSVHEVGTHDKIASDIIPEFSKHIKHVHVWGYDDLSRFLDIHADVRQPYLHLITPGDLIAELMDKKLSAKSHLAETIQLYTRASFESEQYSQLDQAGEIGEKPIPLRKVFVDLDVKSRSEKELSAALETQTDISPEALSAMRRERVSACLLLLKGQLRRTVLIGGPGQGKSTLGQFLAQIHRAYLLQKPDQLNIDSDLLPTVVRVPFRVILKDYAQRLSAANGSYPLETYLAELVSDKAARSVTAENIQAVLKENPSLVILDGLDEVTEESLRANMLQHLTTFVARAEVLNANLQVIATSRQNNYSDQFDPAIYIHFSLITMDRKKVLEYTNKWVDAKGLDGAKAQFLKTSIKDCIDDRQFSPLMNTPLQVTIFILIILNGGTPPRQREELFDEYLEVIYKRERAKSKTIIQTEKRLLFGLHQYMGYLLHRRAAESHDVRSRMKLDEFSGEVFRYLRQQDPFSEEIDLRRSANTLIKEARDRLVLLVELETGYFGFELRSIQEFFAAGYLADTAKNDKQRFERFSSIAVPPHWHNVALFFAGRVGRSYPGEAAQILEVCRAIDRNGLDVLIKRGAWLALDIAVDRSFGPTRTLQQSAIEYSLTILDADTEPRAAAELIAHLTELPKEDSLQLVNPILTQRISKLRPWDDLAALRIYMQVEGAKKDVIEAFITAVLPKSPQYAEKLLGEAVRLNLNAKFVMEAFAGLVSALSINKWIDILSFAFVSNPQYIATLLRLLPAGAEIAVSLFEIAFKDRRHYYTSKFVPDLNALQSVKGSDIPGQIAIAWQLGALLRGTEYWRLSSEVANISQHTRTQLIKLASDPTMTIACRSLCLALLLRASRGLDSVLAGLMEKIVNGLKEKDQELMSYFLFGAAVPSLDVILPVANMLKEKKGKPFPLRFPKKLLSTNQTLLAVVDSLDPAMTKELWDCIGKQKMELKEGELALWKFTQRLEGFALRREATISLGEFAAVIRCLTSVLSGPEERRWRVWASVSRFPVLAIDKKSEGAAELSEALSELLDVLEVRIHELGDTWELGTLAVVLCEIDKTERQVCRLLKLIKAMPMAAEKDPASAGPPQNTALILKLQSLTETDDDSFMGFLKIVPGLVAARRFDLFDDTMKSDTKRAIDLAKTHELSIQRGAMAFLAENSNKDLDSIQSLIEYSRGKPMIQDWIASLVDRTAHQLRPEESVAFVKPILTAQPPHSRALRLAALRSLRDATKLLTFELNEAALGLPFH